MSGVCLTVVELSGDAFSADVSRETLSLTTLGDMRPGSMVNLERSLTLSTPLGGHLVTGHVDGLGEVVSRRDEARSVRFHLRVPDDLARYVARKGSICADGVSLTVNGIENGIFDVNIVPHTLEVTTLGDWRTRSPVNLEVDLVARYIERLLEEGGDTSLNMEKLKEYGFAEGY